MARVVITEFMDELAVATLRAAHDVLFDAKLVDDAPRLLEQAGEADAIVVRNRIGQLDSRNGRDMAGLLEVLSVRLGFRLQPGFSEPRSGRRISRDAFRVAV